MLIFMLKVRFGSHFGFSVGPEIRSGSLAPARACLSAWRSYLHSTPPCTHPTLNAFFVVFPAVQVTCRAKRWGPGNPPETENGDKIDPGFDYFPHCFWTLFFLVFSRFWLPFGLPFGSIFHHFGITFSSIDFASIFHRFWDGFFIDLSSFVDANFAPLPNLANLDF